MSTIEAQAEAIIAIKPSNKIGAEQGARDITKVEVIFCVHQLLKLFFSSVSIKIANFDGFSPLAQSHPATLKLVTSRPSLYTIRGHDEEEDADAEDSVHHLSRREGPLHRAGAPCPHPETVLDKTPSERTCPSRGARGSQGPTRG